MMWEPDPVTGNYADASNYAGSSTAEGLSKVHGNGAIVLQIGGSVKYIKYADYYAEDNNPTAGTPGKGLMWWKPSSSDGR